MTSALSLCFFKDIYDFSCREKKSAQTTTITIVASNKTPSIRQSLTVWGISEQD